MRALVVDGYNVIHSWPELAALIGRNRLEDARRGLIGHLSHYAAATGVEVTVVFDSHTSTGSGQVDKVDGITVRYGSRALSADHVIERLAYKATRLGPATDFIVATSDRLQRDLVVAMGVGVMSAAGLCDDIRRIEAGTGEVAERARRQDHLNQRLEDRLDADTRRRLEAMRRGVIDDGPSS